MERSRRGAGRGAGKVGIRPWRDWERDLSIFQVRGEFFKSGWVSGRVMGVTPFRA